MGVDAGDIDDDGDEDLVVTNLTGEGHDLYVNDGTGTFVNASAVAGISHRSLPYTGFGAGWLDVDNDGWLDLLTVNGAVQIPDSPAADGATASLGQAQAAVPQSRQRPLRGRHARRAGPACCRSDASRGAAFGDVDNDGDTDVVVANNGGAGAAAAQCHRPAAALGRPAVADRDRLRRARRARGRDRAGRPHAVAASASRRQLRIRQRSARHRRPGRAAPARSPSA